eukprot:21112-Heterococcus_DN1.PRE.1
MEASQCKTLAGVTQQYCELLSYQAHAETVATCVTNCVHCAIYIVLCMHVHSRLRVTTAVHTEFSQQCGFTTYTGLSA